MSDRNMLEAYSLMRRVTPFGFDCGRLCGARCCRGGENDGMVLFNGEAELLRGIEGFEIKRSGDTEILICSGVCDRRTRPLACRFYPFYPLIREDAGKTRFDVVYDIRGISSCPAVSRQFKPNVNFIRAVRKAALWLARDEKNLKILRDTAALFRDICELNEKLL